MTDLEIKQKELDVINNQIALVTSQSALQIGRLSQQRDRKQAEISLLETPPVE